MREREEGVNGWLGAGGKDKMMIEGRKKRAFEEIEKDWVRG